MEQQMIANGGLQYVPQIAVQYVYLDFDGELTCYNGEILTVDTVKVQDSALTKERISDIVRELNALYADQNVVFVTERPQTAEYSTIFIGKTEAFSPYGNFAGLAENIDEDNQNQSDNAFVMLDSTAPDSAIISTISHEAAHLLGTLDHDGVGLAAYAADTVIDAGTNSSGLVISHGQSVSVCSGGVLHDTELQTGGSMYVYSGGIASGNDVYSAGNMYLYNGGVADSSFFRGRMFIYNGGVAENTVLSGFKKNQNSYFYASMHISSGALARNTIVSAWGDMHVSRGGRADGVVVHSDGCLFISSGGSGTDITLYEGGRLGGFSFTNEKYFSEISNFAVISNNVTIVGSNMYVSKGGVIENASANYWACMHISSGGIGSNFTIESWGTLYVYSGGKASDFTVNAGGNAAVSSGGIACNVKNLGRINVSGGILSNTTVYAGTLKIYSGGSQKGTMQIASGAVVSAYSGATIDFTVSDRKTADSYLINNLSLITGAPAYTITVSANQSEGRYYLAGGASAFASSVTLKNSNGVVYGTLTVNGQLKYGETTYCLKQNSGDLYFYVGEPGTVSGDVTLYSSGVVTSKGQILSGKTVQRNCSMTVFGGLAENTDVVSGGRMYVSSGGSASGVKVADSGYFYVRSGFVNDLSVVSGSADIRELSYAENLSLAAGRANVYSGTTAFSNIVSSGGGFYVFGGAVASRNTIHSGGKITVLEGGCIIDTEISSGAEVTIYSSSFLNYNTASNVVLSSGATLILQSGSILAGKICLGGTVKAHGDVNAENADIIFDISRRKAEDGYIINDFALFKGGTYFINLPCDQAPGKYTLAANATAFAGCMTVVNDQYTTLGELSLADNFVYGQFTYSLSVTDAKLILEVSSEPEEEKDITAPTIESWSIAQGSSAYNFNIDINAYDDVTDSGQLSYKCRYSTTKAGLATAEVFSGRTFKLSSGDAGKRYYFQFAVEDEAGNTQWSDCNYVDVKDVTAPVLSNKTPIVTVTGDMATVSWENGTDNVGITSYKAVIGNVVRTTSGNSILFTGIPTGKYTCYIQAFDAAGNASAKTAVTFTVDGGQADSDFSSSFKWSGNEYIYIQQSSVTASDFKLTIAGNNEMQYMMTDDSIVDAEKDSQTLNNAYLYMNTCWAATASNIFTRSGWGTGLFLNEDALLKYFTQSFSIVNLNDSGLYKGISGGWTRVGIEWLLNGAPNIPWYSNLSKPVNKNSGAFYKYSIGTTGNYFSEETANFSNGTLFGFNKYLAGSGHNFTSASIYSSYDLLNSAFTHLKDGDAVGMSISWHSNSTLRQRTGGHAVTVYGFVCDESKKGTSGYFTGVIIADSDDDFLTSGNYITGMPATMAKNRVKILDIEYNASKGVYIFSDYGSYGVIDGFQYLEQKPDYITQSTCSKVSFSLNKNWNSYCSVSASRESALNGNRKRISTSSDIYIAVSLENFGLGNSESFSIRAIIDGDQNNALKFSIDQVIVYGEIYSDTVINLGKLTHGSHSVVLEIIDGEEIDSITLNNIFVTGDNSNNSSISVSGCNSYCNLNSGESMTVANYGIAIGTVVGNNAEQIVQNNGFVRESTVASGGILTVEYGGEANTVLIEDGGLLDAHGNVENMRVAGNGFVEAGKNATLNHSLIDARGTVNVFDNGNVTNTEVEGNLVIQNGSALSTKVSSNGFFIQMEGSVTSATEVLDGGYHYIYADSIANGNTVTGETAMQTIKGTSACAYDNTIDAGMQVVTKNGVAENNILKNNASQDIYDGGIAIGTELFSYSQQSVKNATAYDTVINATAAGFVLEGALSDGCLVKNGGTLTVGHANSGAVNNLEVEYGGKLIAYSDAVLYGKNVIAGTLTVNGIINGGRLNDLAADPVLVFDLSGRNQTDNFIINDLSLCNNLHFQITLSGDQTPGKYKLASSAPESVSFSVYSDTGEYWGEVSTDHCLIAGTQLISIVTETDSLFLETALSPYGEFELPQSAVYTDKNSCSWDIVVGASEYVVEFSCDNFASVITVNCSENSISLNNLPYDLQWRVRAKESDIWTTSEDVILHNNTENSIINANKNWNIDLLFAQSTSQWGNDYSASHSGILNEWSGIKEQVDLNGKNRLSDIFEGSTDANILLLTDDANGDALFVDDIFTSLPGTVSEQQARIAKIDEICAGAGDDIVDMTSQRFEYVGDGVKIYGGLGNDTIWSNNGNNTLFGDAGNDRIVGGANNDVIVGGSGNDRMHGGGGEDLFCFGENWGNDIVEQLTGGEITLWFESGSENNWNASTLTYTDGTNSVKVSGISADNISLKFGDDSSSLYDELANSGCFDDAVSEKIFEDKNKGMLA